MRPISSHPLFASAQSLTGVGPRLILLLKKASNLPPGVTEPRVIDLLWHLPTGVIDRRAEPTVAAAVPGTIATLQGARAQAPAPPRGNNRAPYKVRVRGRDAASIDLVFFHAERSFVERQLPVGEMRYISGRIERYSDKLQMTHPDYIVRAGEPRRPAAAGAGLSADRRAFGQDPAQGRRGRRWSACRDVAEWQDAGVAQGARLAGLLPRRCSGCIGRPMPATSRPAARRGSASPTTSCSPASWRSRSSATATRRGAGGAITGDGRIRASIADALPFPLTARSARPLREIAADMAAPRRMLRLLQGDVGSGKTVVALMAMAIAVEAGAQAALMAPTEVLARQHAETIAPLADEAGLRIGLLTGREKGKRAQGAARAPRLAARSTSSSARTRCSRTTSSSAISPSPSSTSSTASACTSASRCRPRAASGGTNMLVMTATPIPRTLLMTHYGDLDVSQADREAGRPQADRHDDGIRPSVMEDVIDALRARVAEGAQVYWVCPLIESSDEVGARRRRGARTRISRRSSAKARRPAARRHVRHGQGQDAWRPSPQASSPFSSPRP